MIKSEIFSYNQEHVDNNIKIVLQSYFLCSIIFLLNQRLSTSDRDQVRMWGRWMWCLYSDGVKV